MAEGFPAAWVLLMLRLTCLYTAPGIVTPGASRLVDSRTAMGVWPALSDRMVGDESANN